MGAALESLCGNSDGGRFCSGALQGGIIKSKTCPPKGGLYKCPGCVVTQTLEGPTDCTVNPDGVGRRRGHPDPQVETCGYSRLAPSGAGRAAAYSCAHGGPEWVAIGLVL